MNKREGVLLVSELEAERILHARGYSKATCPDCQGAKGGSVGAGESLQRYMCTRCEGQGWVWLSPAPASTQIPT